MGRDLIENFLHVSFFKVTVRIKLSDDGKPRKPINIEKNYELKIVMEKKFWVKV